MVYNRARHLHPQLGRFIQRDPIGYVDGQNLYQHLGSNPLSRTDPMGTDSALCRAVTAVFAAIPDLPTAPDWVGDKINWLRNGVATVVDDVLDAIWKVGANIPLPSYGFSWIGRYGYSLHFYDDAAYREPRNPKPDPDQLYRDPPVSPFQSAGGNGKPDCPAAAAFRQTLYDMALYRASGYQTENLTQLINSGDSLVLGGLDSLAVSDAAATAAVVAEVLKNGVKALTNAADSGNPSTPTPGPNCFVAGTLVDTESGKKPIEKIEQDERVWSYNHESGEWELCRVEATIGRDYDGEIVTIGVGTCVDEKSIESTADHPFWVVRAGKKESLSLRPLAKHVPLVEQLGAKDGRWVDAKHLRLGDVFLSRSGKTATVTGLRVRLERARVYNLGVERLHNYAIGENLLLVHNTKCAVQPYEVGAADDLASRSRNDEMQIHHAPQSHSATQIIPGYNHSTAPSIALPDREHRALAPTNVRGTYGGTPRSLLAQTISNLRAHTNAPNSALRNLINYNMTQFPGVYGKP